jgi:DNA repair exonuclease SbcCD ATPase subunit
MRTEIAARKQALSTKREEFEAFRTELNELRAQAIEAMKANNAVRAENARLGSELKQSLESLKNEGTELSQEVIDGLNGYKENLAVLREELKTSKDQILDIRRRNGEFRSSKDYAALFVSFTEIVTIQGQRNECLTDINADLQAMLALLVSEG